MNSIRIGTRGSALAMWQAHFVEQQLCHHYPELTVEIQIVKTQGDIIQDVALASLPGKAFFTKEIEDALLEGRVDLAVHSGKDLPTVLPEGLVLSGFMKRHSPRDALVSACGASLDTLPPHARVGTSSLRRRALLFDLRPDLCPMELRGNVDTRIKKLAGGVYDAILLAAAGLERLGLGAHITEHLDPARFPPAVSQGAIALEARADDPALAAMLAPIIDRDTTLAVEAERALLAALEGGCQVPLGALAEVADGLLTINASLLSLDGRIRIDSGRCGSAADAVQLGRALADDLIARGGDIILERIRAVDGDKPQR